MALAATGRSSQLIASQLTPPHQPLGAMWGVLMLLAAVFWITIVGANIPSRMIADFLFWIEELGSHAFASVGLPWWITFLVTFLTASLARLMGWV